MGIGKGFFGVPSFCSLRPCWFEIKPLTCLSRAIAAAFPLVSLDHIPPKLSFHRFFDTTPATAKSAPKMIFGLQKTLKISTSSILSKNRVGGSD